MDRRTNEADIAAVTEIVRAYYDGSMEGDEAKLNRAFHPRACIVGNEHGELYWATLDEYRRRMQEGGRGSGTPRMAHRWPLVRRRYRPGQALGPVRRRVVQRRLSMLRIDDAWRIVHKTFHPHPGS